MDVILIKSIQIFKDLDSTRRSFTKDCIKLILLIFYKNNPSGIRKKGSMLKYFEAKFNEHLENMASCQSRALYDVPTEEETYSLVSPIYEKIYST